MASVYLYSTRHLLHGLPPQGIGTLIVDRDRVRFIAGLLRGLGGFLECFERADPQFSAVRQVVERLGCGKSAVLVVANSLVSYQLSTTGEVYWTEFAKWVVSSAGGLYEVHRGFLESTRFNRARLLDKLDRLSRFYASRLAAELEADPLRYCGNLQGLVEELARTMGGSPEDKTIAFAGKMLRYVCLACGSETKGDVAVPVDRRNALLLLAGCLVGGCGGSLDECVGLLMTRHKRTALAALRELCTTAGVDCVKLDALTWALAGALTGRRRMDEILEAVKGCLGGERIEILSELYSEFSKCLEPRTKGV
ncbi:MAG: N-glycosylase/DNA lyase [Thermogladius sp.]